MSADASGFLGKALIYKFEVGVSNRNGTTYRGSDFVCLLA